VLLEGLCKLKKSTSSGIRTGDLPACSIVPQPITLPRIYLLTSIELMPGGGVCNDHIFNKKTGQYIARIFTVQYKYMNICTIQVHKHMNIIKHSREQEIQKMQKKTR
jgi:hypothetical protein